MTEALWLVGSYLCGSVPYALLIGLARGRDIRLEGSGNPGATNLGRILGRRYGLLAFLLDFAKGFAPVFLCLWMFGESGGGEGTGTGAGAHDLDLEGVAEGPRRLLASGVALSAVVGHVFPIWLGFRGGKGVATAFGALVALVPLAALVASGLWALVFAFTRTVSIASLAGAAAGPLVLVVEKLGRPFSGWWSQLAVVGLVSILIFIRHRSNIARLLRGEELAFRRRNGLEGPRRRAGLGELERREELEGREGLEGRESEECER